MKKIDMEKETIEIPFGARDSELGDFEYTIPEGFEAEIKDGKVIVRKVESENERIRKSIIKGLSSCGTKYWGGFEVAKAIAWLKRQSEPTDKVEPKFHEDDWVVDNCNNVWQVVEVSNNFYRLKDINESESLPNIKWVDETFHLWDISDAKDGDVLAVEAIEKYYQYPFVAIYKERGLDFFNSYCFIGFDGKFYEGEDGHSIEDIHPATKEQRDILEKAMSDAGFTFNFENKELKKIEQKLAWSEEDEKKRKRIMHRLSLDGTINNKDLADINDWLKSLKDRVQPK